MKNRTISILLAMVMVLSTASMCVFADTPQDVGEVEVVADEQGEATTAKEATEPAQEDEVTPTPEPTPQPPATPQWVETYSAWKSLAIEWDPVADASYYKIYRNGVWIDTVNANGPNSPFRYWKKMYINYGLPEDGSVYNYQVSAVKGNLESGLSSVVCDGAMQPMTLSFTMRQTKKLTSHDGSKIKYTFNKGQRIQAFGYAMGKYKFYYPVNGVNRLFYVQKSRIRKPAANYTRWSNYSPEEAEYFVYTTGVRSATSNLIFASLYTQHIYVMRNIGGLYRINDIPYRGAVYTHWEMASGTASTPSPSGFNLKINKRIKRHSSARWWNCYHSMSAIHGKSGRNGYGVPRSHGCIRNPDPNAEFIYKGTAKGTRVIVY